MDLLKKYEISIFACAGQHDVYFYHRASISATSFGILEKAGLINILSEKPYHPIQGSRIAIYGASYGQQLPVPDNKGLNIGVIHAPIAERAIYPGQNYIDALAYLQDNAGYDLILCGDIHQKFIKSYKGRYIINTGPMLRKEASVYNFQHHPGFFVFDAASDKPLKWIDIPHAPAEQVLSRAHIAYAEEANTVLDEFIKSIPVGDQVNSDDSSFIENLRRYIDINKIEKPVADIIMEVVNG